GEGDSSDQAGQGIIWSEESFVRDVRRRAAPLRQSRDCRFGFADGALLGDIGAAQRPRHAVARGPEAAATSAIEARRAEVSPFCGILTVAKACFSQSLAELQHAERLAHPLRQDQRLQSPNEI